MTISDGGDSMYKYSRDEETWDQLTEAGLEFLVERAQTPGETSYEDLNNALTQRTGLPGFDFGRADERAAIGYLLGLIVEKNYPETKLMISALVTHKGGADPGGGFYALATQFGLLRPNASKSEKDAFWVDQYIRVQELYSRADRP
ncbi:hypothetical protein [Streptosporangium sp. NPDC000509]|uniref:hypothetical protein n=1 Tax=Streptosporangium sp. NPDC000509 TaxID=3366186 RepID=UPI00369CC934